MRRALIQVLLIALGVVGINCIQTLGRAQKTTPDAGPPAQSLSGVSRNTTTENLQALTGQPVDESSPALQAVAQFLQLRPDQIQRLLQLLEARQSALAPLLQNIAELEKQLDELLNSGGAPGDIGQRAIQIHALQQQVMLVQQNFLANFENLLDPDQRQRLGPVRVAAQLQPIVPAFQQLALL